MRCTFLYASEVDAVSEFVVPELDKANLTSLQVLTFVRLFICHSSYFPLQNAANRMVTFWALRCTVCGEAAFLPLVATGHGALNAEAIALLNNGIVVRLPDDSEGHSVLFIDRSRFQNSFVFRNAVLQLIIYMFCVILEEEELSQKKGFVLVCNCKVR
jgi:hypothetical protein